MGEEDGGEDWIVNTGINAVVLVKLVRGAWSGKLEVANGDWYARVLVRDYDMQCGGGCILCCMVRVCQRINMVYTRGLFELLVASWVGW